MPCTPNIKPPIPKLPPILDGITFSLPIPKTPQLPNIDLCCKLPFKVPVVPDLSSILDGVMLNGPAAIAISKAIAGYNTYVDQIQAYLDSLPLDCPRE